MRRVLVLAGVVVALLAPLAAQAGRAQPVALSARPAALSKTCPPGYMHADLSWGEKCLRAGQFCKVGNVEYHRYGFDCPAGHLVTYTGSGGSTTPAPTTTGGTVAVDVGKTVLLAKRTKTSGCKLGPNPDRRCSPGAYYSKLTKKVICSPGFRTSTIRHVSESEKFAVEREYGLAAKHYGSTLEIDHIVSLELGGSNDIANLFPEKLYAHPGYRLKDKLENKLHDLVCSGTMTLRAAQRGIAANWQKLYKKVYGVAPA